MTEEDKNLSSSDIAGDLLKRLTMLRDSGIDFVPVSTAVAEEGETPQKPKVIEQVDEKTCTLCGLSDGRSNVVTGAFGKGDSKKARLMVIGESPSKDEDITGIAFGSDTPEADLVKKIIKAMDSGGVNLKESEVFFCYAVRCFTDSDISPDSTNSCTQHLLRDFKRVKPKAVLAFGSVAGESAKALGFKNTFVVPGLTETVKDPTLKIETWDKVQRIMKII